MAITRKQIKTLKKWGKDGAQDSMDSIQESILNEYRECDSLTDLKIDDDDVSDAVKILVGAMLKEMKKLL